MNPLSAETLRAIERLSRNPDLAVAFAVYVDGLVDAWQAATTADDDKAALAAGRDAGAMGRFQSWLANKAAEAKRSAA